MNVPLESLEFSLVKRGLQKRNLLKEFYLEVGCGDGFNLEKFSKLGMHGVGVDVSPEVIEIVQKKNLSGVDSRAGDFLAMQNFPIQPKVVFMLNVLEHVWQDSDFIAKAASLLPAGGYLVIAVPAFPHEYGFADANAGHVRRYDKEDLKHKIENAGLKIDQWLSVGFPINRSYTRVFNLLNRSRPQTLDEAQTLTSGIRHSEDYYGGGFDVVAKIAFPILTLAIQLDRLFVHTNLGDNFVVFAKKK